MIAKDLFQGGANDNNPEAIQTEPVHTNSLEHIGAQDLLQGGANYNELEAIQTETITWCPITTPR